MIEERQLKVALIKIGCRRAEVCGPKPEAVGAFPTAMEPGTHYEDVKDARVLFLDVTVGILRANIVLIVEPPADGHRRAFDAVEMRENVTVLPILVVVGMRHKVVPIRLADADAGQIA